MGALVGAKEQEPGRLPALDMAGRDARETAPEGAKAVIQARDLSLSYGTNQVLKSISVAPPRDLYTKFLHVSVPARREA